MTECPACGQPVSPSQSACAKCGNPLQHEAEGVGGFAPANGGGGREPRGGSTWLVAGIGIALGCLVMIVLCGGLIGFAFVGFGVRQVAVPNPPVIEAIEPEDAPIIESLPETDATAPQAERAPGDLQPEREENL